MIHGEVSGTQKGPSKKWHVICIDLLIAVQHDFPDRVVVVSMSGRINRDIWEDELMVGYSDLKLILKSESQITSIAVNCKRSIPSIKRADLGAYAFSASYSSPNRLMPRERPM